MQRSDDVKRNRVRDAAAALSLALAVAIGVFWWRARTRYESVSYNAPAGRVGVLSTDGCLWLLWRKGRDEGGPGFVVRSLEAGPSPGFLPQPVTVLERIGLRLYAFRAAPPLGSPHRDLWVVFPYWLAFLAAIVPPVVRIGGRFGRHRGVGHCLGCGYDLRVTPNRCPECGRPTAPERPGTGGGGTMPREERPDLAGR